MSSTFSSAAMCFPVHLAPLDLGRSMQSLVLCDMAPQLQMQDDISCYRRQPQRQAGPRILMHLHLVDHNRRSGRTFDETGHAFKLVYAVYIKLGVHVDRAADCCESNGHVNGRG